jgi:formylglycine-generating enzyme required for sulfatase activity
MSTATWFRLLGLTFVLAVVVLIVPAWTQAPAGKKAAKGWDKEITNSVGMKLVRIPPGKFKMGSPKKEQDEQIEKYKRRNKGKIQDFVLEHYRSEGPQHDVEITREFWLGVYEVTQKQFKDVMGYNPSYYSTDGEAKPGELAESYRSGKPAGGKKDVAGKLTRDFPVENVSWEEAVEFCNKLSEKLSERGRKYRLPMEAEWEYACRGGANSYQVFHFGNSLSSTQANFNGDYPYGGAAKGPWLERTCKVGSYPANAFGLYDMYGNVHEWCADWYDEAYYSKTDGAKDPAGPPRGWRRVTRGGGWGALGEDCRTAWRMMSEPTSCSSGSGFRVVLVPSGK